MDLKLLNIMLMKVIKVIKFTFLIIFFLINMSFNLFSETGNLEIKLKERNTISKFEMNKKILNNKNIDFNKMFNIKIDLESSIINCYFGYQENSRIVLCY